MAITILRDKLLPLLTLRLDVLSYGRILKLMEKSKKNFFLRLEFFSKWQTIFFEFLKPVKFFVSKSHKNLEFWRNKWFQRY